MPLPTPESGSNALKKKWKIKPQNDEGILVPNPKPLTQISGVINTDYIIGKGAEPKLGAKVKITYEGFFPDGTVFDSRVKRTKPLVFRKGTSQVIRGLDLGMEGMRVGGSREIIIPSELG
jgi:FKBP-type peptidyl-prolyl cis-trans isomerase